MKRFLLLAGVVLCVGICILMPRYLLDRSRDDALSSVYTADADAGIQSSGELTVLEKLCVLGAYDTVITDSVPIENAVFDATFDAFFAEMKKLVEENAIEESTYRLFLGANRDESAQNNFRVDSVYVISPSENLFFSLYQIESYSFAHKALIDPKTGKILMLRLCPYYEELADESNSTTIQQDTIKSDTTDARQTNLEGWAHYFGLHGDNYWQNEMKSTTDAYQCALVLTDDAENSAVFSVQYNGEMLFYVVEQEEIRNDLAASAGIMDVIWK